VPASVTGMLDLEIPSQPDLQSCGPTCLQAVYRFYGDSIPLGKVIEEVQSLEEGGTLGVLLACHALERGYRATLFTYNLRVFDPTWFGLPRSDLQERLRMRIQVKEGKKLRLASEAYLRFLTLGGDVRMEDLSPGLILRPLASGKPVLTGLSSTYLFQAPRESGVHDDDIRGDPQGHFVVLAGYDETANRVLVADPLGGTQWVSSLYYPVSMDRLLTAILLGVLTYDANLLVIEPVP
jgi:hypothetical protein